jgi:hypothetical protein
VRSPGRIPLVSVDFSTVTKEETTYVIQLCGVDEEEPSTYEEVEKKKVWKDTMMMCGNWF